MRVVNIDDDYIRENNLLPGLILYMNSFLKQYETNHNIIVPPKTLIYSQKPYGVYGSLSAASPQLDIFITKIAVFVPSAERTVNSIVNVFSMNKGEPLYIFSGQGITNLKTAAVSGLVTDYCASNDANSLAIIGSGVQARQQFYAVNAVRNITKVKVFSRNPSNVDRFIQELKDTLNKDIDFIATDNINEAIKDVGIICTATTSIDPLIADLYVKDKLHINVIGPHTQNSREISIELLSTAQLVVEDIETAVNEAGPVHKNAISLQQLYMERNSLKEKKLTIFSSTGHAMLDLLTTNYLIKHLGLSPT